MQVLSCLARNQTRAPCGVLTTGLPVKLLSPPLTPQKTMNVIHSLSHLEIQI